MKTAAARWPFYANS